MSPYFYMLTKKYKLYIIIYIIILKGHINVKTKKVNTRQSGIELLKIIAMIGIVFSHSMPCRERLFLGTSFTGFINIYTPAHSLQKFIIILFRDLGQLCNIIFVISSAWFLTKSTKVKKEKVSNMILTTLVLFYILGVSVSKSQLIRLLFPVSFKIYWFIQCYLLMYIIHPLLNKIIDNLNQKSHLRYNIIFIILYMIIDFVFKDLYYNTRLVGFIGIYFVTAYFKKYMSNTIKNKKFIAITFLLGIFGWIGISGTINIMGLHYGSFSDKMQYFNHILNPFYWLIAFSLFFIFKQINFTNKFINYISSLTLLIYLLHANPFIQYYFKYIMYNKIYKTFTYEHILLWIVLWAVTLFILSTIAAIIFDKVLRPIIQKISQIILWLLKKIYVKIEMMIFKLN